MSGIELGNKGLISLQATLAPTVRPWERTLIVSGVARSGTSMVARVLHAVGVPMGERLDGVVFEDHEFVEMFSRPTVDGEALGRLIQDRDRAHRVWGFKRPHLHRYGPEVISRFRNPHLIVTLRDPAAIAERNAIAEHVDVRTALSMAADDLREMVRFTQDLPCPVLLISYEKAVRHPDRFVERLLEFCGLSVTPAWCDQLARLVEPDRHAYAEHARRRLEGYVDGIQGSVLSGWACQHRLRQPLMLTVFRDDVAVLDCSADQFRQDLADAGIDDGRHGFAIDLAGYGFMPDSRVTVRVKDLSFALSNSGSSVAELGADLDAIERSRHWAMTPFG